jgi:hypothetical protein
MACRIAQRGPYARRESGGRRSRQPGQVRKEAAVTSSALGRSGSHLSLTFPPWAEPAPFAHRVMREARSEPPQLFPRFEVACLCRFSKPMAISQKVAAVEAGHREIMCCARMAPAIRAVIEPLGRPDTRDASRTFYLVSKHGHGKSMASSREAPKNRKRMTIGSSFIYGEGVRIAQILLMLVQDRVLTWADSLLPSERARSSVAVA